MMKNDEDESDIHALCQCGGINFNCLLSENQKTHGHLNQHVFLFVIVHKKMLRLRNTCFLSGLKRNSFPRSAAIFCLLICLLRQCYCWIIVLGIHQLIVSEDSHMFAMFLPPNITACIQPMDQNVIQNVKLNYRKSLLVNCLALCSENLMDSLKSITLKDTVFLLANCWANVKTSLINKSWKNLHPEFLTDNDEPEDDVPLAQLFNRLRGPNDPQISEPQAQ